MKSGWYDHGHDEMTLVEGKKNNETELVLIKKCLNPNPLEVFASFKYGVYCTNIHWRTSSVIEQHIPARTPRRCIAQMCFVGFVYGVPWRLPEINGLSPDKGNHRIYIAG